MTPFSDIDVLAIVDGCFVIGEAKHNSKSFKESRYKDIVKMVEIAIRIRPDKVMLFCSVDSHNRMGNTVKRLNKLLVDAGLEIPTEGVVLDSEPFFNVHRFFRY